MIYKNNFVAYATKSILRNMNQNNINIFNDTLDYIKSNKTLSDSIFHSSKTSIIYREKVTFNGKEIKRGIVTVTTNRTFEAAIKLRNKYPNKRIAVLNFASATNPGGGVTKGSSAQEESLCRCSTLYPVLGSNYLFRNFYLPNRQEHNPLHNDKIIYSPNIVICKSDDGNYRRLRENEFVHVDVISAAAPNLRERPTNRFNNDGYNHVSVSNKDLYDLHINRGRQIIESALVNNVDILVLGAFGCGAFKNDPEIVSDAYKDLMKEYCKYFDEIEFAIYCREYDKENYVIFKNKLDC